METTFMDGVLYAKLLRGGAANLKANVTTVNDLNVFPIPDGDTGDNMFLTISAGANAAGEGSESLSQTAGKAARLIVPCGVMASGPTFRVSGTCLASTTILRLIISLTVEFTVYVFSYAIK